MSQATILVVQESATQRAKLVSVLEGKGYLTLQAGNVQDALQNARSQKTDLIVSDVALVGADGFSLCKLVRADEQLKSTPVLLLTGLSDPQDVIWALSSGAAGFLLKPFGDEELLSRVQFVLNNPQASAADSQEDPLPVQFLEKEHLICSSRAQILTLLLSTFESAAQHYKQINKDTLALKMRIKELERKLGSDSGEMPAATSSGMDAESLVSFLRPLPIPVALFDQAAEVLCQSEAWTEQIPSLPESLSGSPARWDGAVLTSSQNQNLDLLVQSCLWQGKEAFLLLARPEKVPEEPLLKRQWHVRQELGQELIDSLATHSRNLLRGVRIGLSALTGNETHVSRLDQLVGQLEAFDLFTMEAGPLLVRPARFSLAAMIGEVVQGFPVRQQVVQKALKVSAECPEDFQLLGDARLLRIAVTELFKNAVTASENGGYIYLEVLPGETEVVIQVRDEGGGIPREYRDCAGGRFFSSWTGHLGLGLYLTEQVCLAHNGRLDLVHEESGLLVRLVLPVDQ